MDEALRAYTDAYRELLELAREHFDALMERSVFTDKRGASRQSVRMLASALMRLLNEQRSECPAAFLLSGAVREALMLDAAANLLSYRALQEKAEDAREKETASQNGNAATDNTPRKGQVSYPVGRTLDTTDEYLTMLNTLAENSFDASETETLAERKRAWQEQEDEWRNRLTCAANPKPMPLYFCRFRDFSLQEYASGKWGVNLKLAPKRPHAQTSFKFPLAFGEWHIQEYLQRGTPRAAHLVGRAGEYYLCVAFEFQVEIQPTETILGIDRGVLKQIAYAVIDEQGSVLTVASGGQNVRRMQVETGRALQAAQRKGQSVSRKHWKTKQRDQMLHMLANQIVCIAKQHCAQVVLEDLNIHTAGKFTRSQFSKLEQMLAYKLPFAGLPLPRHVFAAKSSMLCSECGELGERPKENRQVFICLGCGVILDADENASVNIARRLFYRKAEWEKRGGYLAFHKSFVEKRGTNHAENQKELSTLRFA